LLAIMQAQLWFGRGGVPTVAELERELQQQKVANEEARRKIEQLSAEVNDLKEGLNMVEERARNELGMVKPNEILVQIAK
jgi:cell division protein FtsB